MSLGKGNRRNRRQPQTTSIETTRSTAPAFVQNQIQQTFREAQAQQPLVYTGPRVAESNRDQERFFDMTRDFVERTQNEPLPTVDTSNLEALQGRAINTSGIMGMLGRQADVGQLQGMIGSRADTGLLQDAQAATTDLGELGGLMGQQNIANDIFRDFTTREVTPYLETAVDDAANRALQNVNNLYAGSGRLGSTAFADAAARGVTAASAPILQQAAQTDAARQLQAAGLLGQAFQQDRAADIGLATTRAGMEQADLARQLQGAGMLSNLEQAALQRDAQLANQIAGYEDAMLARDLAAQQSMLQAEQADLARELSIAQGLTGASETQARLAPQMQQMQLQSLGMLGAIGDAQQAQQQAELEARRQQIAELNAARQMRMQNMINASQLGRQFTNTTRTTQETPEQQQGGGGLLNTLGGLASTYIGLGAPGLELIPGVGPALKAAAMGAGMINSLGSIPFSSGREEVLMFGPQFNRSALR